ncbi:hypothetical protein ACFSGX_01650 [Sphingomonas arantia]|uniref:Uncharacterized protein n=1 Tax=Sphingomonas arantia TaxID=1460676 RepID=A0ABW4TS21_9SPHN
MGSDSLHLSGQYSGVLELNNHQQSAWLTWHGDDSEVIAIMQLDPQGIGEYNPSQIRAAWEMFSSNYGGYVGFTVRVRGFVRGASHRVLHVLEVLA